MKKIFIVIPFFNESAILEETLEQLRAFKVRTGYEIVFVFSDDGSTDQGIEYIMRAKNRDPDTFAWVREEQNRGKGHALQKGLNFAQGDIIGFLDADLEIPLSDLEKGLERMIKTGEPILIGTKTAVVANRIRAYHRGLASFFYNGLVQGLLGSHLPDHQCGLKLFRQDVWKTIGPKMQEEGWSWDTEFLLRAQKEGYAVGIFDVRLLRKRKSTVRFGSACLSMLAAVLRLKMKGLSL